MSYPNPDELTAFYNRFNVLKKFGRVLQLEGKLRFISNRRMRQGDTRVHILNISRMISERLIAAYLGQKNGCLGMPVTIWPDQVSFLMHGGMLMGAGDHHEMLMDWTVKPF